MGRLLSVGAPDGTVKGYVEHPEVDPERRNGKLNVGGAVGSEGTLTVIKDMGLREPYVGQVHLVSGEIAEDFAMYFTASEQTPSLVSLGVLVGEEVLSAGGLLVQMMPGRQRSGDRLRGSGRQPVCRYFGHFAKSYCSRGGAVAAFSPGNGNFTSHARALPLRMHARARAARAAFPGQG